MIYFGSENNKYQVNSGKYHWIMPSTQYMNNVINVVEVLLKYEDRQLIKVKLAGNKPSPKIYRPELEQNNELIPEIASRYLKLVGILIWSVEIGSIGIFAEVEVMSQYLESP